MGTFAVDDEKLFMSWFVGFWEGEGVFSIWREKTYWNVELSVGQTGDRGRVACEFIRKHLGLGYVSFEKRSNPRWKDVWRWKTGARREIIDLVERMIPYMVFMQAEASEKLAKLKAIDVEGIGGRGFGGWTRKDFNILKREYPNLSITVFEIRSHLKHPHSVSGIYAMAYRYGLRRRV